MKFKEFIRKWLLEIICTVVFLFLIQLYASIEMLIGLALGYYLCLIIEYYGTPKGDTATYLQQKLWLDEVVYGKRKNK